MARTEIITEWILPRYVATTEWQDVAGVQIQDVNGNDLFIIGTSAEGTLVPIITTNWS